MAVLLYTSPTAATERSGGRKILRTSNGTIWVLVVQASDTTPILRYSTDDGANWATSSTEFPETVDGINASWVFCSDGAIYVLYEIAAGSECRVRKGTLNGGHTDISWSAKTTVHTASNVGNLSLAVHEEGGDTIVHVVYATTGTLCEYKRAVWGSAFGSTQTLSTWSGRTDPIIEFHHTLADVTAVKDSTPHIYVAWYEDNKIMFRKAVYSSGPSWAWNAARTITSDAKTRDSYAMSFDGTDCVFIAESLGTAEALLVLERDAADTSTTSLANTPTRNGTSTAGVAITYSPERDIEVFHADVGARVMQRVTYDRSGSAWGSWATIDADADDLFPQVKPGYWSGSKADAAELIWEDLTGTPDSILHERFTFVPPVQDISPSLVESLVTPFGPSLTYSYDVDPGLVDSLVTVFDPAFILGDAIMSPALIDSSAVAFSPEVTTSYLLALGIIDQTSVVFDLVVDLPLGKQFISPSLEQSLVTVFSPELSTRSYIVLVAPERLSQVFGLSIDDKERGGEMMTLKDHSP